MSQSSSIKMIGSTDPRFAYDPNENLDIEEVGEEVFDGKVVHDVSFRGATGKRINAYLVTPIVGHGFPGIVFVHPLPGSRKTFLDEALRLADRRICSIVVDAVWSSGLEWAKLMGEPNHDRKEFIDAVRDIRRTFDVLTSESMVNDQRIGYVGHSLGALCGAVLSGIDRRAVAYVLMSGTTSFADFAAANMPNMTREEMTTYRDTMEDIDPVRFVRNAAPASIMFQTGNKEEYFDHRRMQALADAASEPKAVRWYDAGHALNEQARQDRDDWLVDELFR